MGGSGAIGVLPRNVWCGARRPPAVDGARERQGGQRRDCPPARPPIRWMVSVPNA